MKKEDKSRYEELKDLIIACVNPQFKQPKDFIIPFEQTVIIRKDGNDETYTTETGIMLLDSSLNSKTENVVTPNIGTVMAVGPTVPEYIRPGLKVYFNQNSDLEYRIAGGYYHMVSSYDVYAAIPTGAYVTMDTRTPKEIARGKKIKEEKGYQERKNVFEENAKDKKEQIIKVIGKFDA